jgi:thioredoxin-related protein
MKSIWAFCCLVFLLSPFQVTVGQGISFYEGEFSAAKSKAAKEGKMLMLVVCADWMEACQIMEGDIFKEKEIGDAFNSKFVAWRLDAATLQEDPVFDGVRILSIPEFIFFDSKGSVQYREKGLHDHDQMLTMAKAAQLPANYIARMVEQYKAGKRDPAFVRRFIVEMDAIGQDMRAVAKDYLSKLSREELLETDNWVVALIGVQQITQGEFQYVIGHLKSFKDQYGEENINGFIVGTYRNSLTLAVEKQDAALLAECRKVVVVLLGPEDSKPVILQDEMTFHEAGGNWEAYKKSAVALLSNYQGEDFALLNNAAWNFHEHIKEPDLLKKAQEWATRSVALQPASWNWHTLASLQFKNGDKAGAKLSLKECLARTEPGSDTEKAAQLLLKQVEGTH